ncbi:universal stress protein [Desulfomicrobium baculatum]|uniref:UspA domain protein n=1 Tax=Desulfomicrobium baculatum (strain DSM 4028 / VKM B-1378 / X) TaxID=525897 RepID=C7LRP2_DESBD|nr:universal stress protein [Desulfomicrobium baculatum]ACU90550.1 UspA domain protein [Desulfomicrobium baculatum DSM 4028]
MNRFSTSLLGEAKTLLLATDGSHFSDGALQEAIFFGQACAARLIVLHVVKVDVESLKSANAKVTRKQQEIAPYLEDVRKMARDSGVECETVVVGSSVPEHAIVEQARMREADVIIMGRHGRAGRLYLLVGSMTAKVIGLGFPMVLMLPKDFTMTGTHVLVAVDDSPNSRLAVDEALSLGMCCVTLERLTFVAVARRESGLPEARKMVEDICARGLERWPHLHFEAVAGVGHPSNIIVRAAEERAVDMIMIGGMVSGPLPRMFSGRVTKEVCGWAHCAVLVVTA